MNWEMRNAYTTHKSKEYKWQGVKDLMHNGKLVGVVFTIKGGDEWYGYVSSPHYREIGPCETEQAMKIAIELLLV